MAQTILIEGGSSGAIIDAARAHGELSAAKSRVKYRFSLWDLGSNRFLLSLPEDVHAYEFCNLINWFGDPAIVPRVKGACGWFQNGMESFYLEPDPTRDSGDTLRGSTASGKGIQLYLPEVILAENPATKTEFPHPPSIPVDPPLERFHYDTEDSGQNMNPRLLTFSEHSKIPVWRRRSRASSGCMASLFLALRRVLRAASERGPTD